jgi:predicted DNA-binding transcriptional regulator AlpA
MSDIAQELSALRRAFEAQQATLATLAQAMGTRLTREQYAARLGVSLSTFDRMNKAGHLAKPSRGKWLLADVIQWEGGR